MWFVYVLRSTVFKRSYVGYTKDVDVRLLQHNAGQVAATRTGRPWQLLAFEKFETSLEARRRESYLKTTSGRRHLAKLFESYEAGQRPTEVLI
jgi:putative endonuclease